MGLDTQISLLRFCILKQTSDNLSKVNFISLAADGDDVTRSSDKRRRLLDEAEN